MLYSHIHIQIYAEHKHNDDFNERSMGGKWPYTYTYTNICGKIVNNNDDFNERTNTLLYKNIISHTLFSKGLILVVCERRVGDGDRLLYWPSSSFDHSSTSFSSWLGCSPVGHRGPKALSLPLALNSASCPQLAPTATGTDPSCLWHLVI